MAQIILRPHLGVNVQRKPGRTGGSSATARQSSKRQSAIPSALDFHDLRHTGNQLAAGTGATLRELMDRMGHSSARAALIYLHGSDQRQREIAKALSDLAEAEIRRRAKCPQGQPKRKASGTYRARRGRNAS